LIHSIESVIIDWSHQIQGVLKKDSSQPLLDGLNPGPMVEIEFWKSRAANLENIFEQLRDPKTRNMAMLLEKTQSTYFPAFKVLFKETVGALEEAQDIDTHLKPLAGHFESLDTAEFDEAPQYFDQMFHTICLVWANSEYYCRPARIIVLLQEINNVVIKRATDFLEPLDLFKGEPDESVEKIRVTYEGLLAYKKSYETHKAKLGTYFKGKPAKEWEFAPNLVFARWDKFMEKMNMIKVRNSSYY
jgi:dynein heavy chain, axonemal